MTFAKRDFKNIYESGVKELTDIEMQAIEKALAKKNKYSQEQKEASRQSLEHLAQNSELLQVELKQSINESLKKLQDTLAIENTQSEAFLDSLMTELKTLTAQMKVKLSALKQSHKENVDFAGTVAAEHYLTNTEEMNFSLEHALSNTIQNFESQAKANFQSLQSHLEQTLIDLHEHVSETTQDNLVSLKSESYTIADYSSSLLKNFFVVFQSKLSQLETSARHASSEVESSSTSLKEEVSNHADLIEKKITNTYQNLSTEHFQNADNRLSKFADELSTLHETTTEKLITVTDGLSDDLLERSKQVQDGLRSRCEDVVNRLNNLFASFQTKLNDRLQFSRGQKQALESDKNRILVAIENEMVSIEKAFGKKIAGMLDQSKTELLDLTKSVETQMFTATESLGEKMSDSARSIQQQIEKEVTKFLQEISTVSSAALGEITVAAKGNMTFSNNTETDANIEEIDETAHKLEHELHELEEEKPLSLDSVKSYEHFASTEDQTNGIIEEEPSLSENKVKRNRRRKDRHE